ncbi:MAG TPA: ATP-binding protein [Acidobacteriota bacterium]|jgi:two-component system nitrogen regulation sensor histidine kinase GlnL
MPSKTESASHQEPHEESRRNSEFLSKLISSSNDAIVTTDLHGRIDFWSKPAEQMLGYTLRQALGKPVTEIYFAGKQEAERVMRHLLSGAKVQNWETVLKKVDGSSIHASISIALLKNEASEAVGTLGIVRDISEVKQLQEQVRSSERMATIGELSTHIAHEIRNPLSSVKMNMQILARSQELQGRAREHLNIALQEIDHLESILSEIVDFVRPQKLEKEQASLRQIMSEALLMAEDSLSKSEVEVVQDYDAKLPPLRLDPVRMRQVFLNLILNAIQAMAGRGKLSIAIRPASESRSAESQSRTGAFQVAEIQDTGSGIPALRLAQIFEPFFTTRSDGTGLGLTITKRIIEAHHGSIHVESAEGSGTTFRVFLPAGQ